MQYRAEIDGLRAVAVLPVMLFHADIRGFGGGFVGVDIFFVISGYLITSIIWKERQENRFRFAQFWERRARRILPALLFVLLACIPPALFWLPPHRLEGFAASLLATLGFVSNFHFADALSGYFANTAEQEPLLHTWSLAIEEQFYLLYPFLLVTLLAGRGKRTVTVALALVALASLAGAEWGPREADAAAFFFTPYRLWELMAGALCALYLVDGRAPRSSPLALAGLAMITVAILFYDARTPFPSLYTVLPVGGTALVILYAHGPGLAARLLSLRPLVAVGLISYSAYLWHQPILVFARARTLGDLSPLVAIGLLVLALAMAAFSWKFVEQPFRKPGAYGISKRAALASAVFGTLGLAAVAGLLLSTQGLPQRFERPAIDAYAAAMKRDEGFDRCKIEPRLVTPSTCSGGTGIAGHERIAIIGDSHAAQWFTAMAEEAARREWNVDVIAKGSCPMTEVVIGNYVLDRRYTECERWRDKVFTLIERREYDAVIVAQTSIGYKRDNRLLPVDDAQWNAGLAVLAERLDATGRPWAFLSDNAFFRRLDTSDCLFKTRFLGLAPASQCNQPRAQTIDAAGRAMERQLAARSQHGSVIDLTDPHCDTDTCYVSRGDRVIMLDRNHLSFPETRRLAPAFADRIDALLDDAG